MKNLWVGVSLLCALGSGCGPADADESAMDVELDETELGDVSQAAAAGYCTGAGVKTLQSKTTHGGSASFGLCYIPGKIVFAKAIADDRNGGWKHLSVGYFDQSTGKKLGWIPKNFSSWGTFNTLAYNLKDGSFLYQACLRYSTADGTRPSWDTGPLPCTKKFRLP